mgnify:CR=1 FL=1
MWAVYEHARYKPVAMRIHEAIEIVYDREDMEYQEILERIHRNMMRNNLIRV